MKKETGTQSYPQWGPVGDLVYFSLSEVRVNVI